MNRKAASLVILILWLHVSCDFESPTAFEIPTWNVGLNIPLLHEKYPLSDIVSDTSDTAVIQASGDTIFIQFSDSLPSNAISPEYLQIPLDMSIEDATSMEPPIASEFFSGASQSISLAVPIGETINGIGVIPNIADPGSFVTIPSANEQQITGESWNLIASTVETALGDTSLLIPLYDSDEILGSVPFIESLRGIVIGGNAEDNYFQSSIENVDLPKNIDTSYAFLLSSEDSLAIHDTTGVQSGDVFDKTTSLVGKQMGETVEIAFGFTLVRAQDDDTVTIQANDSLLIRIGVSMGISDLEKMVVVVADYPLTPDMDPVEFSAAGEDTSCNVEGIYGGVFDDETSSGVNKIAISGVSSTYPFDIDFGIKFGNFISPEGDTLVFGDTLSRGDSPLAQSQKLDEWSFGSPDPNVALEELIIEVTANTIAETLDIYLDGTEPDWDFTIGVNVSEFHFSSLGAALNCPFPPVTQEIAGVPTGFEGMSFGEVILQFTMYNQIRMPLSLDVQIVGTNDMGDTVTVIVDALLGYPESQLDTAKTVLKLSSAGTEVTNPDTTYLIEGGVETNTIVDLLNIGPSIIEVIASAAINADSPGFIDYDAAIWGVFELIAPFSVRMDTMIFIPVNSTVLDEFPHDTRSRMRNAIQELTITSRIINGLPVGGELAILLSNLDVFPLDRTSETLEIVRDSLGWPPTDELYIVNSCSTLIPSNPDMYIFSLMNDSTECVDGVAYLIRSGNTDSVISFVDTLFKMVLPNPVSLVSDTVVPPPTPGMVNVPGDTVAISGLDTNRVALLTSLGNKYITTRTQLNGTEGNVVFFSTQDTLEVKSFMTFEFMSSGLFESSKDELVITFPNGGEVFQIGETVTITWRSLGDDIGSTNVNLFSSTGSNPDVADNTVWTTITEESVENIGTFGWTVESADVSDSLWLRICNESESACDRSGYFIGVTDGSGQAPGSGVIGQMTNIYSTPINNKWNDKIK